MTEPPRNRDPKQLWDPFGVRLNKLLEMMRAQGFDPILFEGKRSEARQKWLYGVGRTHSLTRRPVTWTLKSRHLVGKAADIISESRLWDWPEFYIALRRCAGQVGLYTLGNEQCHVQWGKP